MPGNSVWLRATNRILWLIMAGGVLFLCMAQSDYLLAPKAWEEAGHWVYRAAFFIILPFRLLVMFFLPRVDHHFSLLHLVVSCFGTPFFLWLMGSAARAAFPPRRPPENPAGQSEQPAVIGRRQFLARSTVSMVGTAAGTLGGYASFVEPERLHVRRYQQQILDLPDELQGLTLIHVSDTHYGPYTSMAFLERVIEVANAQRGDLIVLTGDYVHLTPRAIKDGIAVLDGLRGSLGRVAVLGNHDHWEGANECRREFRRLGIPLIDNDRRFLTPDGLEERPRRGRSICVAGVGDLWTDKVSMSDALHGVSADMPRILLSHNPDVAESLDLEYRVDLMLSGHTHGGQVRLPAMGVPVHMSKYGTKYLGGRCSGPRCPVLVSRGIGLAGIPSRFRVPPELSVITLARAHTILA
ncbi:MAG: metallophosphoesterase [Candidatus Hydrogenedentes bacterium]|nr:metallophosphoesterase [Candidatus Hydrogenedentota bacterium]